VYRCEIVIGAVRCDIIFQIVCNKRYLIQLDGVTSDGGEFMIIWKIKAYSRNIQLDAAIALRLIEAGITDTEIGTTLFLRLGIY
jgi:hypothetical protein